MNVTILFVQVTVILLLAELTALIILSWSVIYMPILLILPRYTNKMPIVLYSGNCTLVFPIKSRTANFTPSKLPFISLNKCLYLYK